MIKTIEHGEAPFEVIVLHGGPSAPGSASGLAKMISKYVGTIELHNHGDTIEKQINEILDAVSKYKIKKPILVGHSWGAWLAYLAAARHNAFSKIILVGCGAFQDRYLNKMNTSRENKLTIQEQESVSEFFKAIKSNDLSNVDMHTFGYLMAKMDSYEIDYYEESMESFNVKSHNKLMKELRELRTSGKLIEMGKNINCHIHVIHGIEDPHPFKGVLEPFESSNLEITFNLLKKCGHTPWHEKYAKREFEEVISKHIM